MLILQAIMNIMSPYGEWLLHLQKTEPSRWQSFVTKLQSEADPHNRNEVQKAAFRAILDAKPILIKSILSLVDPNASVTLSVHPNGPFKQYFKSSQKTQPDTYTATPLELAQQKIKILEDKLQRKPNDIDLIIERMKARQILKLLQDKASQK